VLAYIHHPAFLEHDMGGDHPECPDRLRAIRAYLDEQVWATELAMHLSRKVTDEALLRAHSAELLTQLERLSPTHGYAMIDADTIMNPSTLEAARLAAGAGILAVDLVMDPQSKSRRAFCAVRPPGHHAERDRAMGFCFFNNIAVAALHALSRHALSRVAIIDFDVHHGNGTENIIAGDERVLMLSTFQSPLYPYSGEQALGENMINVALSANSDGKVLKRVVLERWAAELNRFAPELIFISAGFDAHRSDPLGGLNWDVSDYAWVTEWLVEQANHHCSGRIVSMLEGGYHLNALAHCVGAHIEVMIS
jgi:acetoin utilization deacetylase AcuC-like enzyme